MVDEATKARILESRSRDIAIGERLRGDVGPWTVDENGEVKGFDPEGRPIYLALYSSDSLYVNHMIGKMRDLGFDFQLICEWQSRVPCYARFGSRDYPEGTGKTISEAVARACLATLLKEEAGGK